MNAAMIDETELKEPDDGGASEAVAKAIIGMLGTPKNLFRVDAKKLWENHYRVNVYCAFETGQSVKDVRIAHSYFVTQTDDGLLTSPPVVRIGRADHSRSREKTIAS